MSKSSYLGSQFVPYTQILIKRAVWCTSIPHSHRVRERAALQWVNCKQPNLILSVADSTARIRDRLITRRQYLTVAPRLPFTIKI